MSTEDKKDKICYSSLSFIDTYGHINYPLLIIQTLVTSNICANLFELINTNFLILLEGKMFLCDYIKNLSKMEINRILSREHFYKELNDEHLSQVDNEHYLKVWSKLKVKCLGCCLDLYNAFDVVKNLETLVYTLHTYILHPANYFTTPGLTFDAIETLLFDIINNKYYKRSLLFFLFVLN